MTAYSAVSVQMPGSQKQELGSAKVESDTVVSVSERLVRFPNVSLTQVNFPSLPKEQIRDIATAIVEAIPDAERVIALDRILAYVDKSQILPKNVEGVKADPPVVVGDDHLVDRGEELSLAHIAGLRLREVVAAQHLILRQIRIRREATSRRRERAATVAGSAVRFLRAVATPVGGDDDIGVGAFGRLNEKAFDDPRDGHKLAGFEGLNASGEFLDGLHQHRNKVLAN